MRQPCRENSQALHAVGDHDPLQHAQLLPDQLLALALQREQVHRLPQDDSQFLDVPGLHDVAVDRAGVDRVDGEEFIAGLKEGKSALEYFYSAIPYYSFLSVDAAVYLLPDFLQTLSEDRSQLIAILPAFEIDSGRRALAELTAEERAAVLGLMEALQKAEDFIPYQRMLARLSEIVKEPNQPPEPTTPSGRGST